MHTDDDLAHVVRAWLRTDDHESADRVLADVLGLLDGNTQRVASHPVRRIVDLRAWSTPVRAVAAALIVAVVGVSLSLSLADVGGPRSSTEPSASPSARAIRAPLPTEALIEPGSYAIGTSQARVHLTMPGGWSGYDAGVSRFPPIGWTGGLSLAVTPFEVSHVVADACADEAEIDFVEVGPTVDDLTTALANLPGLRIMGPTDVIVGGYAARKLVLSLFPECQGPEGHGIWADASRTYDFWLRHAETGTVYVVDVNGNRLVMTSQVMQRADSEDRAELEAIIASIEIEPLPGAEPLPDVGPGGGLPVGRHPLSVDDVPFSFAVPALNQHRGWNRYRGIYISKDTSGSQGAEAMILWTGFPDGAETDPCNPLLGLPRSPSPADLAAAVATAAGTDLVSGPSEVTVGGRPAIQVVVRVREDVGCDPGFFFTWDPAPGGPGWWASNVGDTIRVWAVDVDGTPFVIAAETTRDAGPDLDREIQDIVESIEFDE
jgi:hypothetical protein